MCCRQSCVEDFPNRFVPLQTHPYFLKLWPSLQIKSPHFYKHKENFHIPTESRKDIRHKTLADVGLLFMTEITQIEKGTKKAVFFPFFPLSQELSILLQRICQQWEGNISCKNQSPTKCDTVKAEHFIQSQVISNIN